MAKNISTKSNATSFLQKIEKLTKPQRIGIYAGTLVVIIGISIWLLFWPKYKRIETLKVQLNKVQTELAKTKKNVEKLNFWRTEMKKKEVQYKTVMRALPEKEEIPSLLAGVSEAGKDAGLEFMLFQPKPESKKEFYAEIPVDINVTGTYHQVAVFYDKVSKLHRIVNIRNIKMVPATKKDDKSNMLNTSCQAVTYKFIEKAAKPGRKK
ncbi:MAG: type 4a pilus biogenesis protein PilO [Desulfobacteraceae bacterium]|jgi:type IV pilus assembly protein PilO